MMMCLREGICKKKLLLLEAKAASIDAGGRFLPSSPYSALSKLSHVTSLPLDSVSLCDVL